MHRLRKLPVSGHKAFVILPNTYADGVAGPFGAKSSSRSADVWRECDGVAHDRLALLPPVAVVHLNDAPLSEHRLVLRVRAHRSVAGRREYPVIAHHQHSCTLLRGYLVRRVNQHPEATLAPHGFHHFGRALIAS